MTKAIGFSLVVISSWRRTSSIGIASSGQSRRDLVQRCDRSLKHGVEVVLLFQPRDRSVTVFRRGAEPMILRRSGSIDLGDLIPGLQLDLAALFESTRLR